MLSILGDYELKSLSGAIKSVNNLMEFKNNLNIILKKNSTNDFNCIQNSNSEIFLKS
jgi:hypothetical protein